MLVNHPALISQKPVISRLYLIYGHDLYINSKHALEQGSINILIIAVIFLNYMYMDISYDQTVVLQLHFSAHIPRIATASYIIEAVTISLHLF